MGHAVRSSTRRRPNTAICAALLCAIALLAPATKKSSALHSELGMHALRVVAVGSTDQHTATRLDTPHALGTARAGWHLVAAAPATATSSKIISGYTVDSPRTRGPPVDGRS
jgi:hypothetical protein